MTYKHGVYVEEQPTRITAPVYSDPGVQVVVGTAPVNVLADPADAVNKPIITFSFREAVDLLGYSDNWANYSLCQSMDAAYRRIGVGPVIFINVLDPDDTDHVSTGEEETAQFEDGEATVTDAQDELIKGILLDEDFTVEEVVETGTPTEYVEGTDYDVAFDGDGNVILTTIAGGAIGENDEVTVKFTKLNPDGVDKNDIIGGYDSATDSYTGIECIEEIFPRLGVVPGLFLSPGWSQDPEVASVLVAKSEKINGSFNCMNVLDVDSDTVTDYQDVPSWTNDNAYTSKTSYVCWPKCRIGDREYWMSAIKAALHAYVISGSGDVPFKSPSNKRLPITATVADGNEIYLDQLQGNFLNGEGVTTAINIQGWRSWGNNTAVYPAVTDVKDRFIPVRMMFNWWGNTFILTYFQYVDEPANYRLIENIVDSENIRANGYVARGQIAGARIDFRRDENPITQILDGKIVFYQRVAFWAPAKEIVNVLEFDPTMLKQALFGGE